MIRRPVEPSIWWAYAALFAGLAGSIAMWAINLGGWKIWTIDSGRTMRLGWDNSLLCLYPWKVLTCREMFRQSGISDLAAITRFQMWIYLPFVMGLIVFCIGFNSRYGKRERVVILEGPAVSDFKALKIATDKETRNKTDSLPLFNGWSLPPLRQSLGIMMLGQPGSGKTNFLRYVQKSLTERGDRQIIVGYKTNVFANTPPVKPTEACEDPDPILLNPADKRSWIWDIAKDVDGEASCISIARRLVCGKDDFWMKAAQAVITVMLIKLHKTKKYQWTWADLFYACNRTKADLLDDARKFYPDAIVQIDVEPKQYQGVHGTLAGELQNLKLLAVAWPSYEGRQTVSARQFLHGSRYPRTMVVGFSADHPEMAKAWIPIFMTFVCRSVFQTDYKVSKDNRTWVILDELDKLKKVEGINDLISAGREQGISVILGIQDVSQIEAIYGTNAMDLWMTSMQTKIVGRMDAGNSARWLMESLGKTRVRSINWKPGETNVLEWKDEERYALRDNDLNTEFKVIEEKGAWMGVLGVGRDHHQIFVPFMPYMTYRPEYQPASWIADDRKDNQHLI